MKHDLFTMIRNIVTTLEAAKHITQPQQEAWWLLSALLDMSRSKLLTTRQITLSEAQEEKLVDWINRRTNLKEPVQYLIGNVPFGKIEIATKAPVLIPRPETEEWCQRLIFELEQASRPLNILDLCTGSGCIALALAHGLPNATVTGVDISPDAIALAEENKKKLGLKNVNFMLSDLYGAVKGKRFDLIVSNPPYLEYAEWQALPDTVQRWESRDALVGGPDGLDFYRKIVDGALLHIRQDGSRTMAGFRMLPALVMEIGARQSHDVTTLVSTSTFSKTDCWNDCSGKSRVVLGWL